MMAIYKVIYKETFEILKEHNERVFLQIVLFICGSYD